MVRTYLRVTFERLRESDDPPLQNRRAFRPIGWFCEACTLFNLDTTSIIEDIIHNRTVFVKDKWGYYYVQRIYLRLRGEGRGFKAFAKYDIRTKLFITDKMDDLSGPRYFRTIRHLPYDVDYVKAYEDNDHQFNMTMGEQFVEQLVKPDVVEWFKQVFEKSRKNKIPDSEMVQVVRATIKEKKLRIPELAVKYLLAVNGVKVKW